MKRFVVVTIVVITVFVWLASEFAASQASTVLPKALGLW